MNKFHRLLSLLLVESVPHLVSFTAYFTVRDAKGLGLGSIGCTTAQSGTFSVAYTLQGSHLLPCVRTYWVRAMSNNCDEYRAAIGCGTLEITEVRRNLLVGGDTMPRYVRDIPSEGLDNNLSHPTKARCF